MSSHKEKDREVDSLLYMEDSMLLVTMESSPLPWAPEGFCVLSAWSLHPAEGEHQV